MPRFVILRHLPGPKSRAGEHWDLMLECGPVLRTWALPAPPRAGEEQVAESLADHRLAYLDYEGPVLGERGSVERWDGGQWQLAAEEGRHDGGNRDPGIESTLRRGFTARLAGARLRSRLVAVPLAPEGESPQPSSQPSSATGAEAGAVSTTPAPKRWRLHFEGDAD